MVKIALMLIAFILLTGMALMLVRLIRLNLMEGIFLSVSLIIGIMFVSGAVFKSFDPGQYLLTAFGIAGAAYTVFSVFRTVRRRSRVLAQEGQITGRNELFVPAFGMLVLAVLYGAAAFYGVFLQHIDEFHLWGPVVRGMLSDNRLPDWSVYGGSQMYAASFFQLFFLKLTGYSEQTLYAVSFLMTWIGFLLPVSYVRRRDWKKVVIYSLILFFSLYSLYRYSYKSIYVDLPCASWAGGLASWWYVKRERASASISDRVIIATGLITICFMKTFVGILMAVLVLLFILFGEGGKRMQSAEPAKKRRMILTAALTGAAVVCVYMAALLLICRLDSYSMFPAGVGALMSGAEISTGKAVRVFGALANAFLGSSTAPHSRLEIYPFAFLVMLIVWLIVSGWIYSRKISGRVYGCYIAVATVMYLMFLGVAYVFLFSYEEAVRAAGVTRYFSILLIYLFLICLNLWMGGYGSLKGRREYLLKFGSLSLLLLFIYGVNDRFIADATAFNEYQINGSTDIQEAGRQSRSIKKIIDGKDRVYFINQGTGNEYPQNVAYYYLEDQVSNYLFEPWRFTEQGCEIRIKEFEQPTISDLPRLLAEGGYTYLWVYDTDSYLAGALASVFDVELSSDEMRDGQLFRVVYSGAQAVGLEPEKQLNADALTLAEEAENDKITAEG